MSDITLEDLRDRFKIDTKEVYIKAWGGNVTIKKLTIAEENKVNELLYSDVTSDELENNKIKVNISKANEANILRASFALVKPKMKPKELSSLPPEALEGVEEIIKALAEWSKPKKSQKQKGKSNSD